jgi:DHA3 family macrolide efflux protein-like MFS transporter
MIVRPWSEQDWKGRFFTIWTGQAVSSLGSMLVQFALIWWLTEKTGSATVLGTASLAGFLPVIVLGPFAGALVDRWSRRWTLIAADSFVAAGTVLLMLLFALDRVSLPAVYFLLFVRSLGDAFHLPSMVASTSLMVPRAHLTRVQGLNQFLSGGLGILSAPLGALLLELLPIEQIFLIDILTYLAAIVPLLMIRIPETNGVSGEAERRTHAKPEGFWHSFRAGLRYVFRWPGLVMLMLLAMLLNFVLTPGSMLMPLLVSVYFEQGALELAWLNAAFSAGLILGGALLGVWGGFRRRIYTALIGMFGLGVGYSILGLVPPHLYVLAIVGSLVAGLMIPMINGPVRAILQAVVEPEKQGRVYTLMRSMGSAMVPLGLVIAAPLADRISVPVFYLIGGVGCALIGVLGLFLPPLMHIEDGAPGKGLAAGEKVGVEMAS